MVKVLVLGASGMLGSMVVDVLARDSRLSVTGTVRDARWLERGRRVSDVDWQIFAAEGNGNLALVDGHHWVVNCIGITKPLIRDDNALDVERAIRVNALFPYALAARAADAGAHIIQIATDCVYSGSRGMYREIDPHDALDVYGKSKSLGEVRRDYVHNLRCSIIGPESRDFKFLLEWFIRQPRRAQVQGFVNHLWNGVTTLHFARLCLGVITGEFNLPSLQHVVPGDVLTKAQMLRAFSKAYKREDIAVGDVESQVRVDRTLVTDNPERNETLWGLAGYAHPPMIGQMIEELSRFDYRMGEAT